MRDIFAAAKIGSDRAFARLTPEANAGTVQELLGQVRKTLRKHEAADGQGLVAVSHLQ